ncbi:hypothetical protein NDU88_008042 [Pleurodeles waltl]|uniref:Uncharacterized protein n=1 Tax=Pleurodeles waltl TaxID=8319 RepID=A0AAV7QPN4_PLEWA|nr:hypothetical protein NDU88_008042 [Pleurodeles waltl]
MFQVFLCVLERFGGAFDLESICTGLGKVLGVLVAVGVDDMLGADVSWEVIGASRKETIYRLSLPRVGLQLLSFRRPWGSSSGSAVSQAVGRGVRNGGRVRPGSIVAAEEGRAHGPCPVRKAAQGVAATVIACSPPRAGVRSEQVRRQGLGRGQAPSGKQDRVVSTAAGLRKGSLGFPSMGRGGAWGGKARAAKGRILGASQCLGGLTHLTWGKKGITRTGPGRWGARRGAGGSTKALAPEDLSLPQRVGSPSGEGEGRRL